ncbi:hypothetical protein GMDG_00083 [Pseudogymnoascus destructans 20631-21]|uniref:BZIP domain-containing protein n=1 Tax=Pseudogymnoascus destructans (strain ATCC MYA-4855 / 20631-21) TaxID=658429 RepID=L8FLA0_PSED2|nr:hypothetical protein GMDG_00083 [Pseudogymnoascus destructans 20631-21]
MSSQSSQDAMSRSASQANCLDPLDSLLDLSSYETMTYGSPSISPAQSSKSVSFRPTASTPTANTLLPPRQQSHAPPSHPYDAHKQQTGIPTGGLATTLAINNNSQMYAGYGYLSGVDNSDDFSDMGFKAGSASGSGSFDNLGMGIDYDSPTVDPAQTQTPVPAPAVKVEAGNVGRLWPGMHQQQAAKAEQQRKQQQMLIAQQQRHSAVPTQAARARARPATDPIVEEKISQLLNSMRQNSEATSNGDEDVAEGYGGHGRSRKDEEDMDEDEKLLASEEGKKLSSKERRQLRNKVSARAFRSRRKEYIGQLEGEIATRVNENQGLRNQNRELLSENKRLADLTRMLLSSPSFSGFLDTLSTNPNPVERQQQATPPEQQQQTQAPKDPNPYAQQQQQNLDMNINYAMIPDAAPLDFSLLDLNTHDFIYQPQVFSVHSVEEVRFDASVLSGKLSSTFEAEEDKLELPLPLFSAPEPVAKSMVEAVVEEVDEEFDSDPMFSLFSPSSSSAASAPLPLDTAALIAAIQPAKAMLNFELVDQEESERRFLRVQRLGAGIEAVVARLEGLGLE